MFIVTFINLALFFPLTTLMNNFTPTADEFHQVFVVIFTQHFWQTAFFQVATLSLPVIAWMGLKEEIWPTVSQVARLVSGRQASK